jgi:hypothetical protein
MYRLVHVRHFSSIASPSLYDYCRIAQPFLSQPMINCSVQPTELGRVDLGGVKYIPIGKYYRFGLCLYQPHFLFVCNSGYSAYPIRNSSADNSYSTTQHLSILYHADSDLVLYTRLGLKPAESYFSTLWPLFLHLIFSILTYGHTYLSLSNYSSHIRSRNTLDHLFY